MQVKTLLVQPRPLAINMTPPAFAADFAAERRRLLSVDISCPGRSRHQSRRTAPLLSIDGADRPRDGRILCGQCQ